jgi:hypothetical protein
MPAKVNREAAKPADTTRAREAGPVKPPVFTYSLLRVKTGLKAGLKID